MRQKSFGTERLLLCPLRSSDYNAWFAAHVNHLPAKNRLDRGSLPPSRCSKAKYLKLVNQHRSWAKQDDSYWFAVFEKKSGDLIGYIDFDIFVRETHQFANFGYQIFNRYRGRGYGREASAAGLQIGFTQLKLNRLEAAINFDNKKSIRMVKAIGMRREGIKKRYWFENNEWVDHLIYVANP